MLRRPPNRTTHQHGAALITALVILMVLTVIGVSALKTSSLEAIIVGNMRDHDLAFQASETSIIDGENRIIAMLNIPNVNTGGSDGVFERDQFGDYTTTFYDTTVWGNGTEYGPNDGVVDLTGVNADPVFIIEFEQFKPDDLNPETTLNGIGPHYYRITSRGVGKSSNSIAMLQEIYAKRWN